jgi:predicted permease
MRTLWQDLRYGARMLVKRPGFTLIAVMTLALAIGSNTAIFSIVNALLLRPIPGVADPERLVLVGRSHENNFDSLTYPDYLDYRDQNTVFSGMAVYFKTPLHLNNIENEGAAEQVRGELVSGSYFTTLGVKGTLGRMLTPADETVPGANPIAVISYDLWQRRFAADPAIIGKTIKFNAHSFTIIGVATKDFAGTIVGSGTEVWLPITMFAQVNPLQNEEKDLLTRREVQWVDGFARLKPGATFQQAQAEITTIAQRLAVTYPISNRNVVVQLVPHFGMWPSDRANAEQFVRILMMVSGLLLLIACANITNLLLARAITRNKEICLRMALGAGRWRILRQLVTESLLLALLGGIAGLPVAQWASSFIMHVWSPKSYYGLQTSLRLGLDAPVLLFALGGALLTAIIFGLAPAWQTSRTDLLPILREGAGAGHDPRQLRLRYALVAGQVVLSLVVLVGAGLCIRTLYNIHAVNRGYNIDRVSTAEINPGKQGYSEERNQTLYQQLLERVRSLSGVETAGLARRSPLSGQMMTAVLPEGLLENAQAVGVRYNIVTPKYIETIGLRLLQGRDFRAQDTAQTSRVAIISEGLARRLWGEPNPLGRVILRNKQRIEVIGVVNDARYGSGIEPPPLYVYFPVTQEYQPGMVLHVKTTSDKVSLITDLQREMQRLDSSLPIYGVRTLRAQLNEVLSSQRVAVALIGSFGLLALLLAGIGLYGVMSYSVSQRTREIGIRMALGAQVRDVQVLIMRRGLVLALTGVGLGLIASFALTRVLRSQLFGVSATDPLTFSAIASLLIVVALFACYIPARRATKLDPMIALRYE